MSTPDLASDQGLRSACETIERTFIGENARDGWIPRLTNALERVQNAGLEERASYDFQKWWWEDESVAATGQGHIDVEDAIRDEAFRRWLAERTLQPLPEDRAAQIAALVALHEEITQRVEPFCKKTPHLKIFRIIATAYPQVSTTVCHRRKLRQLGIAMGAPRGMAYAALNIWVLDRLDEVIGEVPEGLAERAKRMALPWHLFVASRSSDDETEQHEPRATGSETLKPLPAARRIKGLTTVQGGTALILSTLEFAKDGVTKDELVEHLSSELTNYKPNSINGVVAILQSNFGLLRRDGSEYRLTVRGESYLESQDPSDLADWLLTRVLGVDHAIAVLRDDGPMPTASLNARIKEVNPGWTTGYAPNAIIQWLKRFDVVRVDDSGTASLTERGEEWAGLITWKPEALEADESVDAMLPGLAEQSVAVPEFELVLSGVREHGNFDPALIRQLHAGVWAHERRHFAILTGLSGSGKTLLARAYGLALAPKASEAGGFMETFTIQPGWYDPGALLGYANPLREQAYVATPFLRFLLKAYQDPTHPYTAVFDEMNLSHPEQYMAPLLSAMETGDRVPLHGEGDVLDDVPDSVPYPKNLVIIGTVNMDETTHGLSDKVLDRAFTIEFWDIDLASYPNWASNGLDASTLQLTQAVLNDLMSALSPARLHFGWRVVDEVLGFLEQAQRMSKGFSTLDALDSVVYSKILPKLRGEDSNRFREALTSCASALQKHGLSRSLSKTLELKDDLVTTGSARFWR